MYVEMESNLINGYMDAYKTACEAFLKLDPREISLTSNSIYHDDQNTIILKYLNVEYNVNCATGDVFRVEEKISGDRIQEGARDGSGAASKQISTEISVTPTVKLLIMHYLLNAKKIPLTGKLISFRDVKGGGRNYFSTFQKRALTPLQKTFDEEVSRLISAGQKLGGVAGTLGDSSVTINVFPLIPVTYVLWQGDEEMSSSAAILFDENINKLLPCEDIVLLASFGVYELMKQSRF